METAGPEERQLTHGYWLVAYLDLLGIRSALLATDFLPVGDEANQAILIDAMRASVGTIRAMRKLLEKYFEGRANADLDERAFDGLAPEKLAVARRLRATRIRRDAASDGIVVSCSLKPEEGHFPMRAVYDAIGACISLMLVQLAAGKPIRGGIDVGTGIEVDGELFSAATVKAYELESKHAKYPRLVVGDGLVHYLRSGARDAQQPGESIERQFERRMAQTCLELLKQDHDGLWIVDYAGRRAHALMGIFADLVEQARAFARRAREGFGESTEPKARLLFERYSQLVRYLDACGP